MKNTLLALFALGLITSCNNTTETTVDSDIVNNPNTASADTVAREDLPVMTFTEQLYEFGDITQGEKAEHVFTFTNTGKTDLIITTAKGSCGCTVPQWPKEPIAAGATGEIKVVFNSEGKSGKQHKKVSIVANTQPSTNSIAISGTVIAPSTEG